MASSPPPSPGPVAEAVADPIPLASPGQAQKDVSGKVDASQTGKNSPSPQKDSNDENPADEGHFTLDARPNVSFCDWKRFKNRFPAPGETSVFAVDTVEVLLKTESLQEQIEVEQLKRMSKEKKAKYMSELKRPSRRLYTETNTSELRYERIRINSSIVLAHLAKISGNSSWSMKRPMTFLVPFAFFTHHQDSMKALLAELDTELGDDADSSDPTEVDSSKPVSNLDDDHAAQRKVLDNAMRTRRARQQIRCYVEFVDKNLMPHYRRFEQASHQKPMKVRFDDLWSLFRQGELICLKRNVSSRNRARGQASEHGRGAEAEAARSVESTQKPQATETALADRSASTETHSIVRLYDAWGPHRFWNVEELGTDAEDDWDPTDQKFELLGYSLDFDGTKYAPVSIRLTIAYFRGEKEIHKLSAFPVRFLRSEDALLEQLRERGRLFHRLIMSAASGSKAMAYDGWASTTNALGAEITADLEYIESDIIVEAQEAFETEPMWRPSFNEYHMDVNTMTDDAYDPFEILYWADAGRYKKVENKSIREVVVTDDFVENDVWKKLAQQDPFIQTHKSHTTTANTQTLTNSDLVLLPHRVMAYALRDRKFFQADTRYVREVPWPDRNDDPFSRLRIDRRHKDIILSVVNEHFGQKELVRDMRQRALSRGLDRGSVGLPGQDFIRGKGQGLVILLHGAPGVGKTLTAEAVALSRRRPLFLITCGDLGTSPREVERSLKNIFRLANMWECILLLDEADIFLSQRERGDENITRNAIVSIFLRTLEYYPGILFLTTNRVGVMDEAVKSRVHISLHYPSLNRESTRSLFRMNIERLKMIEKVRAEASRARCGSSNGEGSEGAVHHELVVREDEIMDFARDHFEGGETARWNGRQIRNAFQIAASLAHFEQQDRLKGGGGGGGGGSSRDKDGAGDARASQDTRSRGAKDDNGADLGPEAPYIGRRHFEKVEEATAEFERMRMDLFRKSDDQMAFERMERAAEFYPDLYRPPRQGYRSTPDQRSRRPYGDAYGNYGGPKHYSGQEGGGGAPYRTSGGGYGRDAGRGGTRGSRGGEGYAREGDREGSRSPQPRQGKQRGEGRSSRDHGRSRGNDDYDDDDDYNERRRGSNKRGGAGSGGVAGGSDKRYDGRRTKDGENGSTEEDDHREEPREWRW